MPANSPARIGIFLALAALMALTRFHHFGALPDASWAVFMAGGFYLRAQWRWAFPALTLLAVGIDYLVITGTGLDFWSHYCVSAGYWFLLPAHASMWLAGAWLARRPAAPSAVRVGELGAATVAAVVLCHAFAQGGFYWLSDSVSEPSVAGWAQNYSDWLLPYLRTTAVYVGAIALLHAVGVGLFGLFDPQRKRA